MCLFKSSKIILIACFIWLTPSVNAAQWAVITSEKAPVFSDVQMTSIIGFIGRGKKIRVGDIPKNRGRLLPIIINKKIAYIQVDDIAVSANKDAIFGATKRIQNKMNEKTEETKISFVGGVTISRVSYHDTERNDSEYDIALADLGMRGYYRKLGDLSGIRTGFFYSIGERSEETLSFFAFHLDYTVPAIQTSLFDMLFFVGGVVSPFAEYEVESLFNITGYGLGAHGGVDLSFELPGNWSFNVDGSYFLLKTFDLTLPENELYGKNLNPLFNGLRFSAGLTYSY